MLLVLYSCSDSNDLDFTSESIEENIVEESSVTDESIAASNASKRMAEYLYDMKLTKPVYKELSIAAKTSYEQMLRDEVISINELLSDNAYYKSKANKNNIYNNSFKSLFYSAKKSISDMSPNDMEEIAQKYGLTLYMPYYQYFEDISSITIAWASENPYEHDIKGIKYILSQELTLLSGPTELIVNNEYAYENPNDIKTTINLGLDLSEIPIIGPIFNISNVDI